MSKAKSPGLTPEMELKRCKKGLCPACASDQIEGAEVEIMQGTARQDVSCLSCDAEWAEFYTMDSFSFYYEEAAGG